MKRTLFVSSLLLVGVLAMGAGCGKTEPTTNASQVPTANSSTGTTNSSATTNSASATNSASPATDSSSRTAAPEKEFTVTASQFEFSPSTITVSGGDRVTLHVTSSDVTHGFSLAQFGINKTLPKGETVDIEFVTDEAGTFTFSCSVACGSGHAGMKGTLVVQ